jgi:hypothetical protein
VKLFLIVAIVAIVVLIVVAMQRSGPRITRIDRRVHHDRGDGD